MSYPVSTIGGITDPLDALNKPTPAPVPAGGCASCVGPMLASVGIGFAAGLAVTLLIAWAKR